MSRELTVAEVIQTVVYVDVLIFTNTIINYCMLSAAGRLMHLKSRQYRVILAAFVAALFSLTVYLPIFSTVFSVLIKAGVGLLAAAIAYRFASFQTYLKTTGLLTLLSLMYAGFFIGVCELFHPPNMRIINGIVYFEFHPIVMLALTAIIYLILTLVKKIFFERIKESVVRLSFSCNQSVYTCLGKLDTACKATEPFSGAPVIIVEKSVFNAEKAAVKRVIPYQTIQGSSLLYAVRADAVSINDKVIDKEIYIGSAKRIENDFKAIINVEIMR